MRYVERLMDLIEPLFQVNTTASSKRITASRTKLFDYKARNPQYTVLYAGYCTKLQNILLNVLIFSCIHARTVR